MSAENNALNNLKSHVYAVLACTAAIMYMRAARRVHHVLLRATSCDTVTNNYARHQ